MKLDRRGLLHAVAARRWAMEPQALVGAVEVFINTHVVGNAQAEDGMPDDKECPKMGYYVMDGVGVIEIGGIMLKNVPMSYPAEATSTRAAQLALQAALADEEVRAILLLIDSPGGEVSGVQELGDAVFAARAVKPVVAHISDLGASAAYWVASQADRITANRSAMVGSIGVYTVMEDWSEAYAEAGVQVHLLTSGPYKGAGVEGTPISEAQLKPVQEEIDALATMFRDTVKRGRAISEDRMTGLATGRVWLAPQAQALGLIDEVCNSDEALARLCDDVSRLPAGTEAGAVPSQSEQEKDMKLPFFGKSKPAATAQPAPAAATPEPEKPVEAVAAAPVAAAPVAAAPVVEAPKPEAVVAVVKPSVDVVALAAVIGPDHATAAARDGISERDALVAHIARLNAEVKSQKAFIDAHKLLGEDKGVAMKDPEDAARSEKAGRMAGILGNNLSRVAAAFEKSINKSQN